MCQHVKELGATGSASALSCQNLAAHPLVSNVTRQLSTLNPPTHSTREVFLRNATPPLFHQPHIGRLLRSPGNHSGRRVASSRGRQPQPGRCPPLWPCDVRNDG